MAKTKALISCAVTAQLICVFVFAYANRWFSHAQAHMNIDISAIFMQEVVNNVACKKIMYYRRHEKYQYLPCGH